MGAASAEERILQGIESLRGEQAENSKELALLRQQLLGSAEDGFQKGRLPLLEVAVTDAQRRLDAIELERAGVGGEKKVWAVILRWAEKAIVAGLGALFGAHFGGHR